MVMMIKNILISRYFLLGLAILAFSFYQLINLFYFSSDFTFPDEARFLNSAINLYKTGEYGGAWEMPLTAIVFSLFYDLLGEDGFSLLYIRLL